MGELTLKTIAQLREGLRAKDFTAREIAEQFNAAVAGARALNAYTVETPDDALACADTADSGKVTGSLVEKKLVPPSSGTFPTHTPLFVALLVGVILIVGGLTFFPALSLGPVVDHLLMIAGKSVG